MPRDFSVAAGRGSPFQLKNSVRELAFAMLRKRTPQIGPGSTIATSARVE